MTVRNWEYKDLTAICEMHQNNFRDYWNYKMLADSFLTDGFFGVLIEDESGIIGTVAYTVTDDFADLVHIVVRQDRRKTGVGTLLMSELVKRLDKTERRKLFLEVRKSNDSAIRLYEKFGFKPVSERKKYYGDGEDAVVMLREVNYR